MSRQMNVTFADLDLELYFVREVLKLDSLHYGLWDDGDPRTLAGVSRAQTRYTETLLDLIPEGVRHILDVGCGVGDVSRAMVGRGYHVTALSPDLNHAKYFHMNPHQRLTFLNHKFEHLRTEDRFDLVLMSESQNYFDTQVGLSQVQTHLNPGGYLLISGMFRKTRGPEFPEVTNVEDEFTALAPGYGLELRNRVDITQATLPTLDFAHRIIAEGIHPTVTMLDHYLKATAPFKRLLIRLFLGRQLRYGQAVYDYYLKRTDSAYFTAHVRYVRLLFQKAG